MTKYSDWFKVDLHIHTDFSKKTKQGDYEGEFAIEVLKNKLIENEVKLFSLTDHNIINVEAYESYYESYIEGDPNLLLGCEFDIAVEQENGENKTYHSLLVFNYDKIEDVRRISELLEDYYSEVDKFERKITFEDIHKLFGNDEFFFIPHAGNSNSIISPYRGNIPLAQRMILLMPCALEKVKEKSIVHYNEEFDRLKIDEFTEKEDVPYINFSDNHNCHKYPCGHKDGDDHKFYCIKGNPTYESIRFAFIDPQSRIRKHEDIEVLKNVKKHISHLDIKSVKDVEDITIDFSPNLNTIIGGASSGKSLLFNLIGKKIEHKNDFERYSKDDTSVEIKASNSSTFQNQISFNQDEVIYINQGNVVRYFEKGDLSELVKESGKIEEYKAAKLTISEKRDELKRELRIFKERFEVLNNSFQLDLILTGDDINKITNDDFTFVEILNNQVQINFEEKEDLINDLTFDLERFKSERAFKFSEEEIEVIKNLEVLIETKLELIKKERSRQELKNNFLDSVNELIKNKNNSLDSSSREKSEALRRRREFIESCGVLFENSVEFNEQCVLVQDYEYNHSQKVEINESVSVILEIENDINFKKCINKCVNDFNEDESIYINYLKLLKDNSNLKDHREYTETRLNQKLFRESNLIFQKFDSPEEVLEYGGGESSKNKSPGFNAEMYLKTILEQDNCKLVMIDQPEDNLGNTFKNDKLINLLRAFKFEKQIILVTHNPSIVVYGDAESIILAENDKGKISYKQLVLENKEYQKLIIDNLDGGEYIFDMRSQKYNIKKLLNL